MTCPTFVSARFILSFHLRLASACSAGIAVDQVHPLIQSRYFSADFTLVVLFGKK